MDHKKELFKNFVLAIYIPEITEEQRTKLAKQFAEDIGLDWEEISKGSDLSYKLEDNKMSRAVNPVFCRLFPWLC